MIVVKVGGSLFDHPALGLALRAFVKSLAPAKVLLVPGGGVVADAVRELDRVHGLGEEASHWLALRSLSVTAGLLQKLLGENAGSYLSSFPASGTGEPGALATGWKAEKATSPLTGPGREPRGGSINSHPVANAPGSPVPLVGKGAGSAHPVANPPGSLAPLTVGRRGEGSVFFLDPFIFALEDESRPDTLPHSWSVTTDSIAARVASVYCAERLILLKSTDIPPGTSWSDAAVNGWVDKHFPHIADTLACPIETINFRCYLEQL